MKFFKIDYRLGIKSFDGSITPFSKTVTNYTANIIAKSPDVAKERLCSMFKMAKVDITKCEEDEMSVDEYLGNSIDGHASLQ